MPNLFAVIIRWIIQQLQSIPCSPYVRTVWILRKSAVLNDSVSSKLGGFTLAAGCLDSTWSNTLLPNSKHLYIGLEVCPKTRARPLAQEPLVRYHMSIKPRQPHAVRSLSFPSDQPDLSDSLTVFFVHLIMNEKNQALLYLQVLDRNGLNIAGKSW